MAGSARPVPFVRGGSGREGEGEKEIKWEVKREGEAGSSFRAVCLSVTQRQDKVV